MFTTALKFILYDKPKSIGALVGIIISIFLVGQQAGIFIFLTDAMKSIVSNNNRYIWVVDAKTDNVNQLAALDLRVGRQIAALPGVADVHPVVIAGAGPAGLVTALELARHGVRSLVLNAERQVSEGSHLDAGVGRQTTADDAGRHQACLVRDAGAAGAIVVDHADDAGDHGAVRIGLGARARAEAGAGGSGGRIEDLVEHQIGEQVRMSKIHPIVVDGHHDPGTVVAAPHRKQVDVDAGPATLTGVGEVPLRAEKRIVEQFGHGLCV